MIARRRSARVNTSFGPVTTDESRRIVTVPRFLAPELRTHLVTYAQPTDDDWLFTGDKGGPLGPSWLARQWTKVRDQVGLPGHRRRYLDVKTG